VTHDLPPKALLNPLEFQWLTGNETRTAAIFWNEHNLSNAFLKTFQGSIPVQSIFQFTRTPYHEVFIVGVHLMNPVVQSGKLPLVLEAFTGGHRARAVPRDDVFVIEITKQVPDDVAGGEGFAAGELTIRKLKFFLSRLKGLDHSSLISRLIGDFQLVARETDLTDMTYCRRICIMPDGPISVKYQFEVFLHESGYTTLLGGFKATRKGEIGLDQSFVESFS
jgi:hypothetical protein